MRLPINSVYHQHIWRTTCLVALQPIKRSMVNDGLSGHTNNTHNSTNLDGCVNSFKITSPLLLEPCKLFSNYPIKVMGLGHRKTRGNNFKCGAPDTKWPLIIVIGITSRLLFA